MLNSPCASAPNAMNRWTISIESQRLPNTSGTNHGLAMVDTAFGLPGARTCGREPSLTVCAQAVVVLLEMGDRGVRYSHRGGQSRYNLANQPRDQGDVSDACHASVAKGHSSG